MFTKLKGLLNKKRSLREGNSVVKKEDIFSNDELADIDNTEFNLNKYEPETLDPKAIINEK